MAKISIREMSAGKRRRRSLSYITFVFILAMILLILGAVFISGLSLFYTMLSWETKDDGWTLTKAERDILDTKTTRVLTSEILEIYDSIPEEKKGDGTSDEYRSAYKSHKRCIQNPCCESPEWMRAGLFTVIYPFSRTYRLGITAISCRPSLPVARAHV